MPSHQHESLYQAKTYTVGAGSFYSKPMVLGNEAVADTNFWSTGLTGGGGSHSHGITLTSTSTTSTGSGTAIDSLPPYYTVYTWTRTV